MTKEERNEGKDQRYGVETKVFTPRGPGTDMDVPC